jgi:hypothetical protein
MPFMEVDPDGTQIIVGYFTLWLSGVAFGWALSSLGRKTK